MSDFMELPKYEHLDPQGAAYKLSGLNVVFESGDWYADRAMEDENSQYNTSLESFYGWGPAGHGSYQGVNDRGGSGSVPVQEAQEEAPILRELRDTVNNPMLSRTLRDIDIGQGQNMQPAQMQPAQMQPAPIQQAPPSINKLPAQPVLAGGGPAPTSGGGLKFGAQPYSGGGSALAGALRGGASDG